MNVNVEKVIELLDWEKGRGKVMVILRQENNQLACCGVLRAHYTTAEELRCIFTGTWEHGGMRWRMDIGNVRVDCDADAVLISVLARYVDIGNGTKNYWPPSDGISVHGQCVGNCFPWASCVSRPTNRDDFVKRWKNDASLNLLPVVVVNRQSRDDVLMCGWLNEEAHVRSLQTGLMHFYSRSRDCLWQKGKTSGHCMRDPEFFWQCDEQALIVFVDAEEPACHEGYRTCFFREVMDDGLETIEKRVFDPKDVYGD